jgi:hypothetical protein
MAETNSFGQYKDFTNICGTAFQPFVAQQIEKRKELVLRDERNNGTLQWLTNKSAWVKVSSGVNVDQNNPNFVGLKGDLLSKKYTLQAGLMDHSEGRNSYELRSGIGPDGAYGIGGKDFGYRPMPGITDISIKTGGKLGTLREATIDFVCYNKEQLDIMDALYMKLGMSVLVEWGHIPYIDNNGKLETNPQPLPFYGIHTKEDLMIKIQEYRVIHDGNYDAMWGTIKNWSFSLEDNGTFKCQVSLVGAGDVLESLKINQAGSAKNLTSEVTGSPYPAVTDANLSILNNALYDIFSKDIFATSGYGDGTQVGNFDYSLEYVTNITKYLQNLPKFTFGSNFETDPNSFCPSSPLLRHGYQFSLLSGLNSKKGNGGKDVKVPLLDPKKVFSRYILPYEINGEGVSEGSIKNTDAGAEQVYITLSHLLLLVLATGGIFDKNESINNPYIYIDVNPDTNRCYTFPGHISLDPTVCLIGSQKLPFGVKSNMFNVLRQEFPFFDPFQPSKGRFMYTLVNVNFITTVLKNNTSKSNKGDVYFVDFIQEILNGINKATGGYNEYRIVPDDDTRCIRIFDDRRITKPLKDEEASPYTVIPVLGKDSIAYNFNYTSRISPNTATMVVISSQAEPTGANISNEALAFSKLREGLTNRLSPVRVGAEDLSNQTTLTSEERTTAEQQKSDNFVELREFIKGIYSGEGGDSTKIEQETQQENKRIVEAQQDDIPII